MVTSSEDHSIIKNRQITATEGKVTMLTAQHLRSFNAVAARIVWEQISVSPVHWQLRDILIDEVVAKVWRPGGAGMWTYEVKGGGSGNERTSVVAKRVARRQYEATLCDE